MKRETYVSIPQPCHESWDAMTSQDKVRFCASCAKTVIDFSQMTDTQVLRYLSQSNGRSCGRFEQEQLERPLVPVREEKKKIWWMAALMPLTLLLNKANGQFKKEKEVNEDAIIVQSICTQRRIQVTENTVERSMLSTATTAITGTIANKNGIPISGAFVIVAGAKYGASTDTTGKFCLNFSQQDSSERLIVSAIGYIEKELHFAFNGKYKIDLGTQYLEAYEPYLGGIVQVMAGGISVHHPVKKVDTIKTTIRKIFHSNPFKVYPNPVNAGAAIHIEVKNEGHYSIQLLDANSKLIAHSLFDAAKGAATTTITIPSSATAGIYFIRLTNDDTKQQYTDKIIVE